MTSPFTSEGAVAANIPFTLPVSEIDCPNWMKVDPSQEPTATVKVMGGDGTSRLIELSGLKPGETMTVAALAEIGLKKAVIARRIRGLLVIMVLSDVCGA
jgi:hypothetical protein